MKKILFLSSFFILSMLLPHSAQATVLTNDILIKGKSFDSVYYYADGKRYVFPNEKTYFTWYSDFNSVQTISDAELAVIPIGANATYRPGARMVKIDTDPKVYAVDRGGILRWVTSEQAAKDLYGANWNKMIDDIADYLFTNYTVGDPITSQSQFSANSVKSEIKTIRENNNARAAIPATPATPATPGTPTIPATPATPATPASSHHSPPATPQLVDPGVSIQPGDSFNVRWNDVGSGTEYILQQDTNSSFSNPVSISTTAIYKNFVITESPVTYYFRVRATNAYGQSAWSNTVDMTVSAPAPTGTTTPGTLSISVASDSPSSNIPDEMLGVTLAKFNFKATGENIKISSLTVVCTGSPTTRALKNIKILLDGVQNGATDGWALCDGSTDEAKYSFGNSFILPVGATSVVSIVADMNASATAENWADGDTLIVGFGGVGAAQGRTSLADITPTNINGKTLTVKKVNVSVMKNQSFADRSFASPTGAAGDQDVKVGSFVVTTGPVEAADVSKFTLRDNAAYFMGNAFQNLKLKDSNGSQVGSAISSLNTSEGTYTFMPTQAIRIAPESQKIFDVYADIKSSIATGYTGIAVDMLEVDSVSAIGETTGLAADFSSSNDDIALQKIFLSSNNSVTLPRNLTIDEAADTPISQQLVMGSTGVILATFKLSANDAENIVVTQLVIADEMSTSDAKYSLRNFKLYNGSILLATVSSLDSTYSTSAPCVKFTGFTFTVPKNQSVTLTVRADLTAYNDGGTVNSMHRIIIPADYNPSTSEIDLPVTAVGAVSGTPLGVTEITDQNAVSNYMTLVRAKLSMAFAADTPSGAVIDSSEQTIAKFRATNSSNVGNYSLWISKLNFAISSSGNSINMPTTLNVYKDAVATANKLITTEQAYVDSNFGNLTNSLEIAAGSSKTIIVTMKTSSSGFGASDTLSIGMAADDMAWSDGAENYTTVDSLPLPAKTLVY